MTLSGERTWRGRPSVRALAVAATVNLVGCGAASEPGPSFDVTEKSIAELNAALQTGEVSSRDLVRAYLDRIDAYDRRGPALNAVVTISPDAMDEAAALDGERAAGRLRGPLHGIPVLVKDNYDTWNMPTTAGAIGLATSVPPDDASQVRWLREAGAIVLGKTNMHELARGITTVSSRVGPTRNPYDPARNPGGSSGGTGAAIAASFAAVGMGSDTCGSIRIPSAHHALVGLRGTRGLASSDGIVPLSSTQDIGGPLARTVADLAVTLDVTVGYDPADPATAAARGRIPETYLSALDESALRGARLGVMLDLMGSDGAERPVRAVIEAAVEQMTALGAELVEVEAPDLTERLRDASVIGQEFKFDFDRYLRATPGAPVRSLAEFVELGLYHEVIDRGLQASLAVDSLDTEEYRSRLTARDELRDAVTALLDERELDAVIYPTIRQTARSIGEAQPGSNCALSAVTGLPAITVPGGFADDGMPVGVELLGRAFAESRLLGLAYAFERATEHRRPPDFTPSLTAPPSAVDLEVTERPGTAGTVTGRAGFTFHPATRRLDYRTAAYGLLDRDVLSLDLHRRADGEARGPVLRLLGDGAREIGAITLTGREVRLLRDGALYVDVHTTHDVVGAVGWDLHLP